MSAYTVHQGQLPGLFRLWAKLYKVHVPVQTAPGFYDFAPWEPDTEIAWDYDLTVNPLKRHLLPPREDLVVFDTRTYEARGVFQAPQQLLFGVHPYDLRAIAQLDQLMELGSPDRNYRRRRENTVIFALDPLRVAPDAFWSTLGAGRADIGFDLYWTKIGPAMFFVEVGTARGEELLLAAGEVERAGAAQHEAARRTREDTRRRADGHGLKFPWQELPRVMAKAWDAGIWREKSSMCLACGSCNLVCPTCYCFDMREELDESLGKGRRWRQWDACMLPAFAQVAGGHNFRGKHLDRYRHRYFRKGKYIFDLIGEPGCVGCGRCIKACTARIANPLAVFNRLWEEYA
ncbi:4Fe-4S dicluster domain-containing protein [Desulfocurvus sp.]|jgi:ferredoxin|uniref:4Fe-4S dicluster domain-containing protein n=1 Tax=Desulfocurvus sp. TaxID=2871698 RepID=UPI0025B9AA9A|nr:4Fe-4S dicluster domain-containing protein [Desulfocurvus sp.]MCK9240494.1 4Fe-4S dicluster domain-containing protein [Desulfocurvus sp.]